MVDYSASPAVTQSDTARTEKDNSSDPEQGQIRVIDEVDVVSQGRE